MTKLSLAALLVLATGTVQAEQTRQHDPHMHGTGALDIAMDGTTLAMEFRAPGADIVGFEYAAASDADKATVAEAITRLSDPLTLFVPSAAAECVLDEAEAELHHEMEAHGDGDEDHDDEHAQTDDGAEAHDADDDHAEHGGAAKAGAHTEFHAAYRLTCANPGKLETLAFPYFDRFGNAEVLEIRGISSKGSFAEKATRETPSVALKGRI